MEMKLGLIFLALIFGVNSGPVEDLALQEFTSGNHQFTANVYKELIKKESGNVIFSPLSAETALGLTSEGAKGDTFTELVNGLSLPNTTEKIRHVFKNLLPKLRRSEDDLKLLSANKAYVGKNVQFLESFDSIAKSIYDSGIENVNFVENTKTAGLINSWVEDHTDHKIKNLIQPDMLTEDTVFVLVNALYFNGKWATRFEDYATKKRKFYRTKTDIADLDTMYKAEALNYYENPTLNAKFLELPYKGADISMVIVLPNEVDGLTSLEQNLDQVFQPQPFAKKPVSVYLPKFTLETSIDFIPILKALGVKKLFESADLSGITGSGRVDISHVVQKAFIEVTEAGTKAAAATAVIGAERSANVYVERYTFKADHPFLYYIRYNDVILFAGRFSSS